MYVPGDSSVLFFYNLFVPKQYVIERRYATDANKSIISFRCAPVFVPADAPGYDPPGTTPFISSVHRYEIEFENYKNSF